MSAQPEFKSTITDEVNVSAAASEKLVELLNSEEEVNGVRIFVSGGGCGGMTYGMTFAEAPTQYDSILEKDGVTVYVDAVALAYLSGVEIDYVDQGMGSASFVFKNVFAATGGSGTCGACGAAGGGCA